MALVVAMLSNNDKRYDSSPDSGGGDDCHDVETDDVITVISYHVILALPAGHPLLYISLCVVVSILILCCYR